MRSIRYTLLLVCIPCFTVFPLLAQSAFDPQFHEEAARVNEHLDVFTDRSLYVVNEEIRFRADYRIEGLEPGVLWSDVLYMELVSASGQVSVRSKHTIQKSVSSGSMVIPPDVLTGNYYLKCYTRWMRNRGPATFSYVPLKIINPFSAEVVEYTNGNGGNGSLERESYQSGILQVECISNVFERGKEALFQLSVPGTGSPEAWSCCVTIVPVGAIDILEGQYTGSNTLSGKQGFSLNYLPDLNGASISGRLLHQDGTPGAYAMLHVSLLGSDPVYFVTTTDEFGRFVVSSLGSTGENEIFVAADPYGDQQVEVMIDQDFDQVEFRLPDTAFALSDQEREVATNMAVRMQLARTFSREPLGDTLHVDTMEGEVIPFYGTPGFRLEVEEFIDLPTLEEVFTNLVPMVSAVRRQGSPSFIVEGTTSATALYPPLVMIDYIPVFDQEAVMQLIPERIRRIEVINEVYVRGNVSFGGVISILSTRGDMAGIDLPQGSYFFDFLALDPDVAGGVQLPDPHQRIPDSRNTLLWLDKMKVERGIPLDFRCIMPEKEGEYVVLVRGTTPAGEVHAATTRFRVE